MVETALLFILLVPANWLIQFFSARNTQTLHAFKAHWTCYWGDWIFVVINAAFFFHAQSIQMLTAAVLFAIAIAVNLYTHQLWGKTNTDGHLFYPGTSRLSIGGWFHLLFSSTEMTIVAISLLLPTNILLHSSVLLFAVFILIGSKKIHGRIQKMDAFASILLLIALITNLLIFSNTL